MRVRTHDGKEGKVISKNYTSNLSLIQFDNGKQKIYKNTQLTELTAKQPTKPPSRAHDHLLITIETIEGMKKTAKESKTEFARGAEMAYSLVLEMLNDLK